jgi:hypothetical protein
MTSSKKTILYFVKSPDEGIKIFFQLIPKKLGLKIITNLTDIKFIYSNSFKICSIAFTKQRNTLKMIHHNKMKKKLLYSLIENNQ